MTDSNHDLKHDLKRIFFITIGTFLLAVATNGVLLPNKLLSGGISGISMFLKLLFGFNMSITILVLNIPLFILAFLYLNKYFVIYSLFGMSIFSFWLQSTKNVSIDTGNPISIILVAGILLGLGNGVIFRGDGSTGGTDIIAKIINKYFSINMATISFSINFIILTLSVFIFGIDLSVLTLATMFVSSTVTNFVVDGLNYKRTLFVITDSSCYQYIAADILKELHRGVTVIPAVGAYTNKEKYILYTNVGIRQVAQAKRIILSHDSHAFITISEAAQVIGNGRGFIAPTKDS